MKSPNIYLQKINIKKGIIQTKLEKYKIPKNISNFHYFSN